MPVYTGGPTSWFRDTLCLLLALLVTAWMLLENHPAPGLYACSLRITQHQDAEAVV